MKYIDLNADIGEGFGDCRSIRRQHAVVSHGWIHGHRPVTYCCRHLRSDTCKSA